MAHSYSPDDRRLMMDVARASISHGLTHGTPRQVDAANFPPPLRKHRATFVTLHHAGALRGCIGTLTAHRALVEDVTFNAFAAAFRDPRFDPVTAHEIVDLDVHLSILSPPQPMAFTEEVDLLRQLVPGVDGLVLEASGHRGTFLPAVWESLPDPADFLRQLKVKAGLDADAWPRGVAVSRYTVEDVA